ncbi:MAG: NUDIX domain-containing protein [Bacillota bacterium]|nr:NUDIX domain-containing protein [Bacillota bacterium]
MRYTVVPRAVVLCGRHMLLVRSSPGLRSPSSGRWHLPGGEIRAGESPQRAIARVVAERSALRVEVCGCLDALVRRGPDPETGRQVPLLHLFFVCRPASDSSPDLLPGAGAHTADPSAEGPSPGEPDALHIGPPGGADWGWTDLASGLGALKHDVVGEAVIEHIAAALGPDPQA